MRNRFRTAAVVAVCLIAVSFAAEAQNPGARGPGGLIRGADKNGDGEVTFEEFSEKYPNVTRERFDLRDVNKDGVLSAADRGSRTPGQRQEMRGKFAAEFMKSDTDEDGQVSYEEAAASTAGYPRRAFDRLDTNGDGQITQKELESTTRAMRQGGPEVRPNLPPGVRPNTPPGVGGNSRARALAVMLGADSDGDGKVTYEEVRARFPNFNRVSFDALDRNRDGFLSTEDPAQ